MTLTKRFFACAAALVMLAGSTAILPAEYSSFGTNVGAASAFTTYEYASGIKYTLYDSCIRIDWDKVSPCNYYVVQICKTNGTIVSTTTVTSSSTRLICPYTQLPLDATINGSPIDTDFAVSVIGVFGNGVNDFDLVPYITKESEFTLSPDMTKYETYGVPINITAECTDTSMKLNWTNSSVTTTGNDSFKVEITDRNAKTVALYNTKSTTITINKLGYNNTYTAAITNLTYNATAYIKVTVKDTSKKPIADTQNNNSHNMLINNLNTSTSTTTSSSSNLAAPKNLKAKAGTDMVTLTWSKVSGADAYRVYMYDQETRKYVRCKTVKSNKATISGLIGEKSYKFRIAAVTYNSSTKKYTRGNLTAPVTSTPKSTEGGLIKF